MTTRPNLDARAPDPLRAHIVAVAADLLAGQGRDAVTTRAVAAAAGVQAPTLYRLFGDKDGLLDAVVEHGFAAYLARKEPGTPGSDPVDDLRRGWDLHIAFGLDNPALYALMYADARPGRRSAAAATADHYLRALMRRLAMAGQLRVGERRAADLAHATACGIVLTLLSMPENARDTGLSNAAREAVIAAIVSGDAAQQDPAPATAANALRAVLPDSTRLSAAERRLLDEWLDRLIDGHAISERK